MVDAGSLPDFLDHSTAEVTRAFAEGRFRGGSAAPGPVAPPSGGLS